MDARKRQGSAVPMLCKKPRRTARDKSEFVSVEVGMREFKKRLDAMGKGSAASTTASQVEELIQVKTRTTAKTPRSRLPRRKPVMAMKTSVAVKKTTRMATKTAALALPLAQVKLQLQREQKERVEHRIQTLRRRKKPMAIGGIATEGSRAPASLQTSVVATDGQEIGDGITRVVQAEGPLKKTGCRAAEDNDASTVRALPTDRNSVGAVPVASSAPRRLLTKNDYIADDVEEDLIFAMALDEAERKRAMPQKTLPPSTPLNSLVSGNPQMSLASPVPAKVATLESYPGKVFTATQQPLTKEWVQIKQAEAIPEVVEEMERLRRENVFLRRSNELLQAAVTSTSQATKDDTAIPPQDLQQDVSLNAPAGTSTARYLDLARCNSELKMKQKASSWNDHQLQEHVTDCRFTEKQSISTEIRSKYAVLAFTKGDKNFCDNQHKHENEPATEPDIATEHASELPHKVSPQNRVAKTPIIGNSVLSEDDHLPTQPTALQRQPDQEDETALLRPPELSSSTDGVVEDWAHVTNEIDDGDVSDVSMADVDEEVDKKGENEEAVVKGDDAARRMSTVDSGNYAEYKVRQENDHDDADNECMDEICDSIVARKRKIDAGPALSAHVDFKTSNMMPPNEPDATRKPGIPAEGNIFGRTTASSNSGDEDNYGDAKLVSATRRKRREAIALSSSSSECESESEDDEMSDAPSLNVLEAALHAVEGNLGDMDRAKPSSIVNSAANSKQHKTKDEPSVAVLGSSLPSISAKNVSKKRKTPVLLSACAKNSASISSSLLWPALDEFYDFLLDMSPLNGRESEQKRDYLRQYADRKLPAQYASIEEYCGVQLEAVMEELMASVRDTVNRRAGGSSGSIRHLPLVSVSPCAVQRGSISSSGLSFGAIFSESGFTGSTSNCNDHILTFDPSALGKKSSSEFSSGDLVLVRSPRWKKYEMYVFGVVLCDSVVAVGGKSGLRGKARGAGSGDGDQICVLIRAHKRDQDDAMENFSVLTELCLSNQRAPKWRWSLQQIHSTITSAREFQAIKAISFFPNDLQQALLCGRLTMSTPKHPPTHSAASSSVLSPCLLKHLRMHYNDSQMQAILGCLGEDSRVIIQGPPGTGKTKTIVGLLSALLDGAGLSTLQRAKGTARIRVGASLRSARTSAVSKSVAETSIRVLVAAPSNAAVDELVVRVLSEGLFDGEKGESYRPQIVRVGRPESSQQLSSLAAAREASESKKNCKKMRKYAREVEEVLLESLVTKHRSAFPTVKQARQTIIKNAQIVFCTLSGAGSVAMCEFAQDFDALIIDEAAQAVEASTLIPFKFRPHRVVLVGDHRQLPATVISKKLVSMGYDRSLQQRLVENNSPVLLLTQQYRMHPQIAEFPSSFFYGGRLVQDDNMREWTAQNYHRDRAFQPLLFYDVQGAQSQVSGSTSLRNMNEVEAVVQLVRRLLETFPQVAWKKRIGIIAPYKQQICEVRGAIGKLETEFHRHLGIEVNTVDGFQGREMEIIIYSCVRTSHGGRRRKKKCHDDAFWADERRMNVAITRAKSSLWIIGNSTLLNQSRAWKAFLQHLKGHDRYIGDRMAT